MAKTKKKTALSKKVRKLFRLTALRSLTRKQGFKKYYVITSLLIMAGSTIFWSYLSARVHQTNADQLVNPYMMESRSVLKAALFPGQHTYLLKWPLFFIVHLFGESTASYEAMTVAVSLATVGIFAWILHKIESRPFFYGTLILALASVLMLIPAQPYPGGILPVNMGMIANRNLEYVLFIGSIMTVTRSFKKRKAKFWLGCLGLSILIASDKLFLSISLGGALFATLAYIAAKNRTVAKVMLKWLLASALAAVAAFLVLESLWAFGITRVSSQGAGPYNIIFSVHRLGMGLLGVVFGVLTNFGANPAYDTIRYRQFPAQTINHLLSLGGLGLIVNLLILMASGIVILKSILISVGKHTVKNFKTDSYHHLSLILLWASAAAIGAFVVTDHYYVVDARYLTILLFASFVTLAVYLRSRRWAAHKLALGGLLISLAVFLSIPSVLNASKADRDAEVLISSRNSLIVQALLGHPVNTLAGDYWRVLPIRQLSHNRIPVMPLSGCTQARDILSSLAWQPNLEDNSFAYILSLDKSLTDYPRCGLSDVTTAYGKPNASVVIAGSLDVPTELLLFYDHGVHKSAPAQTREKPQTAEISTAIPIPLEKLPNVACSTSTTIMNIVAHEDDDLLFINPDVQADIRAGHCVRTVYVTAGDAGSNEFYWLGREQGSEAAYSNMIGTDSIWIQRTVKLADNRYITVVNPKGNPKISLIFMRLPDGNLSGQGFAASNHETLQKLYNSKISKIESVYAQSVFSRDDVISSLEQLIQIYKASIIRTQSDVAGDIYHDHSDHMAVGRFAQSAFDVYKDTPAGSKALPQIVRYIGYPIREMPANVNGSALAEKIAAFLQYAKHDSSVCQTEEICTQTPTYGSYLMHQYTAP